MYFPRKESYQYYQPEELKLIQRYLPRMWASKRPLSSVQPLVVDESLFHQELFAACRTLVLKFALALHLALIPRFLVVEFLSAEGAGHSNTRLHKHELKTLPVLIINFPNYRISFCKDENRTKSTNSPDKRIRVVVFPHVSVELTRGPEDLPAGLAGELLAQVDLVVDGHVPHLALLVHLGPAQVAHELPQPLPPLLGRDLGHLHVWLALGKNG